MSALAFWLPVVLVGLGAAAVFHTLAARRKLRASIIALDWPEKFQDTRTMRKYSKILLEHHGWKCQIRGGGQTDLSISKPPLRLPVTLVMERELPRSLPLLFVGKLQQFAERWHTIVVAVTDFELDDDAVAQCNRRSVYPIHYKDLVNLERLVPAKPLHSQPTIARQSGKIAVQQSDRVPQKPEKSDSSDLLVESARAATERREWSVALREWEEVKQRAPDRAEGYIGAGQALRELGRLDEAEARFAEALERFPADPWAAYHHANVAVARSDWGEAVRRWMRVRERFPDFAPGYVAAARALLRQRLTDQADALIEEAATRFPADRWVAHSYASMATRRRNWAEALRAWQAVMERFPAFAPGIIGAADTLRAAGRHSEADEILSRGMQRFPAEATIAFSYAELPASRGEWSESLSRWQKVKEKFPSAKQVDEAMRRALSHLSPKTDAGQESN